KFCYMEKNKAIIEPVKAYLNSEISKKTILSDNRKLSGIYRWVNTETGDTYVGSAVDLTTRLRRYYNTKELEGNPRHIDKALLKYGHSKFKLEILEYCDRSEVKDREQHYLDSCRPEYNILTQAYSLEGFKHSPETLDKLKGRVFSEEHKDNLSQANIGRIFTEETLDKLSKSIKEYRKNNPLSEEALKNIKQKTTEREGVGVILVNKDTGEETKFSTQTEAGEFLGISRQAVKKGLERNSVLGKLYNVKLDKTDSKSGSDNIGKTKEISTDDYLESFPSIFDDVD
uniref:hypothetical protein n=1 Tax=Gonatophragmium mori TaxID=2966219 RepID=UPI0023D89C1B